MAVLPDRTVLAGFCKEHHIRRLALFGSRSRDDAAPHSDIDFLVEYDPESGPGLVELQQIEDELSELCGGRRVDLVNPKYLNPRLKSRILAEAQLQYADAGGHALAPDHRRGRPVGEP